MTLVHVPAVDFPRSPAPAVCRIQAILARFECVIVMPTDGATYDYLMCQSNGWPASSGTGVANCRVINAVSQNGVIAGHEPRRETRVNAPIHPFAEKPAGDA